MERRIATRGIIVKNGKLFAVVHKKGKIINDFWAIPGGGVNPHESLHDGVTRELIEETGVTPKVGKLLFVQQYRDENREYLEFFFHIENPDDFVEIDLTSTSHGHIEIDHFEFINPKAENILPVFLKTIDIEQYITTDQPVYFYSELG